MPPTDEAPQEGEGHKNGSKGEQKPPDGAHMERWMLRWTGIVAVFTGLIFFASIVSTAIMFWQLQEMARSYEIAKRALLGVERPYLIAQVSKQKIITGKLPEDDDGKPEALIPTDVVITISNGGRQSALIDIFAIIIRPDIDKADRINPKELLKDEIEDGKVKRSWLVGLSSTDITCDGVPPATYIPAGSSITVKCNGLIYLHEARALLTNRKQIFLLGGVNYRSPLNSRWQVGFTLRYEPPRLDDEKDGGRFEVVTDPRLTYDVIVEDTPPE